MNSGNVDDAYDNDEDVKETSILLSSEDEKSASEGSFHSYSTYRGIRVKPLSNKQVVKGGSAIKMFRRKWLLGPEDLILPATFTLMLRIPGFVVALLGLTAVSEFHANCDNFDSHWPSTWLYGILVTFGLSIIVDSLTIFYAARTNLFEPNQPVVILSYIRLIPITLFNLGWTIAGTVIIADAGSKNCYASDARLLIFVSAFVLASWGLLGFEILFLKCAWNRHGAGDPVATDTWENRCRKCMCFWCWRRNSSGYERHPDTFKDVGAVFAEIFGGITGYVPSDIAMGFMLLQAIQKYQQSIGRKFYLRDELDDQSDLEQRQEKLSATYNIAEEFADDPAMIAHFGIQPLLHDSDWHRLSEMRYYSRYAIGAYGNLLHCLMEPTQGFTLCGCCLGLHSSQTQEIEGWRGCCDRSVDSFLRLSETRPEDLLCANQKTDLCRVAYYAVVDRVRCVVVICIRGTLSVRDLVTDGMALCVNLDRYGFYGEYAHEGLWQAAVQLFEELSEKEVIKNFLKYHPNYEVRLAGHSLGAGVAALLALLLKPVFPSLHAYTYGSPSVLTEELATSEETKALITSVVNGADLVSRLSVHSLKLLKRQIFEAFQCTKSNKVGVFVAYTQGKMETVLDQGCFDFLPIGFESPISSPRSESGELEDRLENLHVAGVVYHILTNLKHRTCGADHRDTTVYRCSVREFNEFLIVPAMMSDHLPHVYLNRLWELNIPDRLRRSTSDSSC